MLIQLLRLLGTLSSHYEHRGKAENDEACCFIVKQWLRKAEAILILFASFAVAAFVVRERTAVTAELSHLGFWAYPLAILLLAVVASAPFSVTDALAVMNGVIFGPLGGSIVNALGILLAAVIGYTVALRTSALLEIDKQIEHLPAWIRRFRVGSFRFLVAVRVIPGIGGTVATQVAAAMRVPLWLHVAAMAAIAIPICTVLAITGNSLAGFLEIRVAEPMSRYIHAHHPHRFGIPSFHHTKLQINHLHLATEAP